MNRAPSLCASGCGTVLVAGKCPTCTVKRWQSRTPAHLRGYDRRWRSFRKVFLASLVELGILPVCGAALPTGPTLRESACADAQILTFASADGSSLHLDHEPKLEDWERGKPERVCDATRIVLKCAECHNAKTAREMAAEGSKHG